MAVVLIAITIVVIVIAVLVLKRRHHEAVSFKNPTEKSVGPVLI